jgi:FkbM family methyltransferase
MEAIAWAKALARKVVPEDQWRFLSWARARFGTRVALAKYLRTLTAMGVVSVPIDAAGEVFVRTGTADQNVYDEVFVENEYELQLDEPPKFIVDAGAHIGLASVYFARRYPDARILAIEPEPSNFALLALNVAAYPNVKTIQAGLWRSRTRLRVVDNGRGTWSFSVKEDNAGGGVNAIRVQDALDILQAPRIDVLKIDIEGAEVEVLEDSAAWIGRVGTIVIELHDRHRTGCTVALERALAGLDYDRSRSGESVVISHLRPKAA